MEMMSTAAKAKADVAIGTAENAAASVVTALGTILEGKGAVGESEIDNRIFNSLRNRLFLKFSGIDYEVLCLRDSRDDKFSSLIG
jgi:hypothetical protein